MTRTEQMDWIDQQTADIRQLVYAYGFAPVYAAIEIERRTAEDAEEFLRGETV